MGGATKTASSDLVKAGKFILTEKKEYIDLDKAQQALQSALYGNDTFNKNLRNGYQKLFNAMPAQEQAKYTDVNDFLWKNVSAKLKLPQTTESKLDENQFAVQAQSQAFQARENALNRDVQRRGQDIQLELAGLRNQKTINPEVAGAYKVELMTNLFKTGKADLSVLQAAFGDNKEVEVTTKKQVLLDPTKPKSLANPMVDGGESTKEKKPRHEVIGSNIDAQGNVIIDIRDNVTGKLLPRKTLTEQDASNAFNNILGKDKAGIVADGTRRYLKNKTGSENFDINKTAPLFGFNDGAQPAASAKGYANPTPLKDRSGKTINAGVKDGKWYNIDTGQAL